MTIRRLIGQKILTYYALMIFLICAIFGAIPLALFYRLVWPRNEGRKQQFHHLLWLFFRWCARHIPGTEVRLINPTHENFVKPAVIICNHQSHLDLLCSLMLSPKIVAMTNQWVWNFPLYSPIIRYLEFYPAADGIESNEEKITSLLKRGYSILIFPEGTRSANCKILRFHRGAFYLAQRLGVDILPLYLDGPGRVLPKEDFTLYPGIIQVEVGMRVGPNDYIMGATYQEKTRGWRQKYIDKIEEMKLNLQFRDNNV